MSKLGSVLHSVYALSQLDLVYCEAKCRPLRIISRCREHVLYPLKRRANTAQIILISYNHISKKDLYT